MTDGLKASGTKSPTTLASDSIHKIKEILHNATSSRNKDIPGLVVSIYNTHGQDLLTYATGKTGVNGEEDMSPDTMFWLASFTKLITSVAIMQLVEQGKVSIDDGDQLETILPELKDLPILSRDSEGKLILIPKKNKITMRHLLAHTSGFGYAFFSADLREYLKTNNISGSKLAEELNYLTPLLFEPGSDFAYGAGNDIAGLVLERITGIKLGDYCQENIFKPLNLQNITFDKDSEELQRRLVKLNQRYPDGFLRETLHIFSLNKTGKPDHFHSGGGGAFGTINEYAQFLAMVANDGVSPITNARIINPESVKYLFTNQVPHLPNFGRKPLSGIPGLTPNITEFFPQKGSPPQGWAASLALTLVDIAETGRAKGTVHWYGLANMYFWIDAKRGIVAVIGAQVLPFLDPTCLKLWQDVEREVYNGLIDGKVKEIAKL